MICKKNIRIFDFSAHVVKYKIQNKKYKIQNTKYKSKIGEEMDDLQKIYSDLWLLCWCWQIQIYLHSSLILSQKFIILFDFFVLFWSVWTALFSRRNQHYHHLLHLLCFGSPELQWWCMGYQGRRRPYQEYVIASRPTSNNKQMSQFIQIWIYVTI